MHADDEEAAEPHREKDDARLVARSAQIQGGVAQREPARRLQRPRHADQRSAEHVQRPGDADEAPGDVGPHLQGGGLPPRHADQTQAGYHRRRDPHRIATRRAWRLPLPQQQQRLRVARIEQRHQGEQQRHEHADGQSLQHRREGQIGRDNLESGGRRRLRGQGTGYGRQHTPGDADPEQGPAQPQQGHLHHVDGQHAGVRGPEALQDGGAAEPLLHEYPGHAPDADAAQDDDDEADEAEIVLRPREVALDAVLRPPVGADADKRLPQVFPQGPHERLDGLFRHPQQKLPVRAAREPEQAGFLQRIVRHQHAGTEAEAPELASRLGHDGISNRERLVADQYLVADRDAELRQQLPSHQSAPVSQQHWRVRGAALQREPPVEGKRRLHAAHLDHLRAGPGAGRQPRHRHGVDRLGQLSAGHLRCPRRDPAAHLVGPRLVRPDVDVPRRQAAGLRRQRGADVLHQGAEGDDTADADRDAAEEEDEAAPGRPQLPVRHAQDEVHGS